jgi:AcrR family transcriptional regulator
VVIARTREDILMGAARALARRGFGAVSMQDIADEVGFTAPALYAYFDSKEAILADLVRTLGDELAATFEAPPPGLSFRQRVALLVRRQLEWADRRRDAFIAFFALKMRGEGEVLHAARGRQPWGGPGDHLRQLGDWIRRAAPKPADLHGHDPAEAASFLMGIVHGFFLRWITNPRERLADQADRILDFFFYGLLGPRS